MNNGKICHESILLYDPEYMLHAERGGNQGVTNLLASSLLQKKSNSWASLACILVEYVGPLKNPILTFISLLNNRGGNRTTHIPIAFDTCVVTRRCEQGSGCTAVKRTVSIQVIIQLFMLYKQNPVYTFQ